MQAHIDTATPNNAKIETNLRIRSLLPWEPAESDRSSLALRHSGGRLDVTASSRPKNGGVFTFVPFQPMSRVCVRLPAIPINLPAW
jgi:hypothetical protein